MKVIDPGHIYELDWLDVEPGLSSEAVEGIGCNILTFVKREGPKYPGNVGHYPGTQMQEVLRALIDRVKYVNKQIPTQENDFVLQNLRNAMWWLERRAAWRHNRPFIVPLTDIEWQPTCSKCGHIGCEGECHP